MKQDNYVGKKIKQYRTARGWSQEKLALQAEINTAFLGHLERGLKIPTVTTLRKITEALDITLSDFFNDDITGEVFSNTEKQEIIDRIVLTVRNLSVDELAHVADAVYEMSKLCENKD
ncbi:MAG: helix-turn-helix domain-containing protein [Oscillospiraceae bacterium]|nr:helix-turn-helix domain-containing protein [Oscillospiraceae bacterium]